jgi:predicted dehydrogenase
MKAAQGTRNSHYTALLVGAGRIGFSLGLDPLREQPAAHAFALAAHRRIRLAAAMDIDPQKLGAFRKKFPGARTYTDLGAALLNETPDIVVIAVPEAAHEAVARAVCAARPRLVILEKPVAPNMKAAQAIAAAAKRYRVPVSVNHERRFSRDYIQARALLAAGALGEVHGIRGSLWSGAPVWIKGAEKTGACSLLHDGTHLVDAVRFLFGRDLPAPVIDLTRKNRAGDIVQLCLHYSAGPKPFVQLELAGNKKVFDFEIEVTGAAGRLHVGNGFFRLMRRQPSRLYSGFYSLRRDRRVKRPEKTGYFSLMVENCVDFLDGREPLVSPLVEGMKTLAALYRIATMINDECC